jgi:hypothetical protein
VSKVPVEKKFPILNLFVDGWENRVFYTRMSTTARQRLTEITDHFVSMENSDLRMDCLVLIASGVDNANDTLGWSETEEHAALAIRSIECLLETESEVVQSAFKSLGISH